MAFTQLPESLPKGIVTYVRKSNELEVAEPAISYFCKLFVIEEILASGLHTTDESIADLTGEILTSLESQKADDEALTELVNDKDLSITYVLNFADKIFNNALKHIQAQKSTKQTAFNLLTSVTFYEILGLWKHYEKFPSLVDPEELNKRKKYAKFHAARILKSLKSGKDPNEYVAPENEVKPYKEQVSATIDEDDGFPVVEPDGSNSDGFGLPTVDVTIPQSREGSVEPSDPPRFVDDEEFERSTSPKSSTQSPEELVSNDDDDESGDKELEAAFKKLSQSTTTAFPSASDSRIVSDGNDEQGDNELEEEYKNLGLPAAPSFQAEAAVPSKPKSAPAQDPKPKPVDIHEIIETGEIYTKAQKHAKFAISAMNYEDKATAIKELQDAIDLLSRLRE